MRTKKIKFIFIASFAMLCSCNDTSQEQFLQAVEKNVQFTNAELAMMYQMRGESSKVDFNEACIFANDVIAFLDADAPTRAGTARKISTVTALTTDKSQEAITRSSDRVTIELPDTIAYLFNFGEDEGYAIISGDKRIDASILGYCSNGALTGEVDNPAVYQMLGLTEEYIINSIIRYENQIDFMINEILTKMEIEETTTRLVDDIRNLNDTYMVEIKELSRDDEIGGGGGTSTATTYTTTHGDWITTDRVQPLLPVEWNQRFPFDNLVKTKNGCTTAPAGCVAVAVAQLMAYWQHPASIYNYKFNWPLLRSYTARPNEYPSVAGTKQYNIVEKDYGKSTADEKNFVSQVSNLMNIIGMSTHMDYSDNGSNADPVDAINFLSTYGYNAGPLVDYNYNKVIQSLNNGRPVYASGKSEKIQHRIRAIFFTIGTWSEYGEGHSWVVDGYLNQRKATTVQITVRNRHTGAIVQQTSTTTYSYANYLHHNWGWDNGDRICYNGYFAAGSYDSYDKRLESDTRATTTYDEGNFQFLKKICPDIRPR